MTISIQSLYEALNLARTRQGFSPCQINLSLELAAEKHAYDMWLHDFVSHTGSDGSDFIKRVHHFNSKLTPSGEIIQKGPGGKDAINSVVRNWLNSEGHKRILLDPMQRWFGASYRLKNDYIKGNYWVVVFAY